MASFSRVRANLYVGNIEAALSASILNDLNIRSVFSLIDCSAANQIVASLQTTAFKVHHKHIAMLDSPDADLLSHLSDSIAYVRESLSKEQPLLIHCISGTSRSAAVTVAYLMAEEQLTFDAALHSLCQCRPTVRLSDTFVEQLRLFEEMGNVIDPQWKPYKEWKLRRVAEAFQSGGEIPSIMAADPVVSVPDESLELYRCRKCRRLLFTSSTTLTHERGEGSVAFEKKKRGLAVQVPLDPCSSYFAEPVEWMRETLQIGSVDGKLLCPKCKARIGSFNWAGMQCSCARWITPAFQFHKSRIDKIINSISKTINA
ncbi:dual specificity protein phosphatase 12-like isoform X2 [Oscarella lobularis]|uniref:dual specificity protein phosphatase 12-like isoform X2 n=1 Tax=Oscarella lobularis TaxID=121494 RepID=UPI003313CC1B